MNITIPDNITTFVNHVTTGMNPAQAAKACHLTPTEQIAIRKCLGLPIQRHPQNVINEVVRLLKSGCKMTYIAKKLNISYRQVVHINNYYVKGKTQA